MAVKTVAVLGAGTMGRGIAQVAAQAGYRVFLYDIEKAILDGAAASIEKTLARGIEKGKVTREEKNRAMSLITLSTSLEESGREADLVIEAVPEILDLKIEIFQQMDRICPGHTVLATNTSTMSITEIGANTARSGKTITMHFFNPVHIMKLVEIVLGLDTTAETVDIARDFSVSLGKETVLINEFPGFSTSRVSCLLGNEAYYMVQEGVGSVEDIDRAIKLGLNHPMGPLELTDLVGLDVRLRNLEYLHKNLGEKFRPCPLLVKYVKAGRLGRKTGRGFYEYKD